MYGLETNLKNIKKIGLETFITGSHASIKNGADFPMLNIIVSSLKKLKNFSSKKHYTTKNTQVFKKEFKKICNLLRVHIKI